MPRQTMWTKIHECGLVLINQIMWTQNSYAFAFLPRSEPSLPYPLTMHPIFCLRCSVFRTRRYRIFLSLWCFRYDSCRLPSPIPGLPYLNPSTSMHFFFECAVLMNCCVVEISSTLELFSGNSARFVSSRASIPVRDKLRSTLPASTSPRDTHTDLLDKATAYGRSPPDCYCLLRS